ncbi:MAG: hypothetical protein JXQ99_16585 [Hyphomicrobiaceae bacterium]
MTVISFSERLRKAPPPARLDWSNQEIADFYHAQQVLRSQGVGVGIDRGLTDIGEPWLVLFDDETQDVYVHIARIDGRCILRSDALGLKVEADTVAELIASFDTSIRALVRSRTDEVSNVVLHPTARIILSLALLILLLKFDGQNAAIAEEQSTDAVLESDDGTVAVDAEAELTAETQVASSTMSDAEAARRADIISRAQAFLARAADAMPVDAPTAMAGAAQLMLLAAMSDLEAAENRTEQTEQDGDRSALDATLILDNGERGDVADEVEQTAVLEARLADAIADQHTRGDALHNVLDVYRPAEAGSDDIPSDSYELAARDAAKSAQRDEALAREAETGVKQLPLKEGADEAETRAGTDEEAFNEIDAEPEPEVAIIAGEPLATDADLGQFLTEDSSALVNTAFTSSDNTLEAAGDGGASLDISSDTTNALETKPGAQTVSSLDLAFEAQKAVMDIIDPAAFNLVIHDNATPDNGGISAPNTDGLGLGNGSPTPSIDVALSSLDSLLKLASFVQRTDVRTDNVGQTLQTTLATFEGAEVEFSGGNVLIEQAGADDADPTDLGVWVNTLSDESQIIIVGQAAAVDGLQSAVLS